MMRTQGVRHTGSAVLDLCCVACGRVDALWEFGVQPVSWSNPLLKPALTSAFIALRECNQALDRPIAELAVKEVALLVSCSS